MKQLLGQTKDLHKIVNDHIVGALFFHVQFGVLIVLKELVELDFVKTALDRVKFVDQFNLAILRENLVY